MKKVLIADDEMYARQMMATIVDWADYNLELAGEAASGGAVFEFLERTPVDLLVTDLTMPGMDAITYLRALREKYPRLVVIVLTMHQEFEMIQEALRVGVDDYIAKAQVESESFDALLRKVLDRMLKKSFDEAVTSDICHVLFAPSMLASDQGGDAFRLVNETVKPQNGSILLKMNHTHGLRHFEITFAAREFYDKNLFYTATPGMAEAEFDMLQKQSDTDGEPAAETAGRLSALLDNANWIIENATFEEALSLTPKAGVSRERLPSFFYRPIQISADYIGISPARYFDIVGSFLWWHEWETWLRMLHGSLLVSMTKNSSSLYNINLAISYLQEHYGEPIALNDILCRTSMSKTQFSALFKTYTGTTFMEYLKKLRIEQAKRYLIETGWNIAQIAEKTGYSGERNFRKAFLQSTGESPRDYRKKFAGKTKN